MTEPLPPSEFDATSVEPDGYIEIVYKTGNPELYPFKALKFWRWEGPKLIIVLNQDGRIEIPDLGIRRVNVKDNSEGYVLAQEFIKACDHIKELENQLRFAHGKMLQKRKEMLRWHATS